MSDLCIYNIGLLVTPLQCERENPGRPVHTISHAAILIRDGRVALTGPEDEVCRAIPPAIPTHDAQGALALPGLVDCHTHPVFVGNRAVEFHLRNAGKTYLEIAAAGGGIAASAEKVRRASLEQIIEESLPRFHRSLRGGVTTIEAKSGYGLDWEGERKLLDVLSSIEKTIPQRMHKTFLIHALPQSYAERRADFTRQVVEAMIPAVAEGKLASAVDVFCEQGAFTVDESREFLLAAKRSGLNCMVHANQFGHSGGALLAAEVGARSANHLEYLNDQEIAALAQARVVGVALPGCVFFLNSIPYPPIRRMIELGMRVAVATDMNPGSAMTESLPFCVTAGAIHCKMSPAELLWAVTLDAARTLDADTEVGSLEPEKAGDVSLWNVPDLESLSYYFGNMQATAVVIDGKLVWEDKDATLRY
ncbi:MAG: imidazolonepropionase [Calditrichota bacterium]